MIAAPPPLSSCCFATLARMSDAHHATDEILIEAEPPLVFCPLGFERRAFQRFGKLPVITIGPGAEAVRRAFAERARWPVQEPRLVVLLGLAGGLRGTARAGQSVSVATIVGEDGTPLFRAPVTDAGLSVVEAQAVVATSAEKRALAVRSGADLVDTESRAFAACASAARLPWAIVRGVADDVDTNLPRELAGFVDASGETRMQRVLAAVLRRPSLIADLARIGRTSRAAMRHASFDADALGCLTGLDLCGEHTPLVVFGGSFDPPHARHATALADAMRALHAPAAMVIPAAVNPFKTATPPADAESRLAMCRASFAPGSAEFPAEVRLSRIEIDRAGPSYTIDTLSALVARRPKLAGAMRFLVGSDSIRGIASWHRWRELLAIARPAVVVRPPDTRASAASFLDEFARASGFADAPGWLLDVPSVELDSTSIRAAIARGERPPGLADGVWSEITRRRLYGFGDAR